MVWGPTPVKGEEKKEGKEARLSRGRCWSASSKVTWGLGWLLRIVFHWKSIWTFISSCWTIPWMQAIPEKRWDCGWGNFLQGRQSPKLRQFSSRWGSKLFIPERVLGGMSELPAHLSMYEELSICHKRERNIYSINDAGTIDYNDVEKKHD